MCITINFPIIQHLVTPLGKKFYEYLLCIINNNNGDNRKH